MPAGHKHDKQILCGFRPSLQPRFLGQLMDATWVMCRQVRTHFVLLRNVFWRLWIRLEVVKQRNNLPPRKLQLVKPNPRLEFTFCLRFRFNFRSNKVQVQVDSNSNLRFRSPSPTLRCCAMAWNQSSLAKRTTALTRKEKWMRTAQRTVWKQESLRAKKTSLDQHAKNVWVKFFWTGNL